MEPALNVLVAGEDDYHLHFHFPYTAQQRPTRLGLQRFEPLWNEPLQIENGPRPGPIRQAVDLAFERRDAMAPSGVEPTVVWMRAHGYTVSVIGRKRDELHYDAVGY
ncbi:hypothetical protein [Streptomyces sp. NPDC001820]|uniref:hypothetical protein n=1 Tax=Streptomyces sp. NPDC001820 TaxID=3364613 RepID=UPI0036B1CDAC